MAHRTNVTQVPNAIPEKATPTEQVTDPVCGMKMSRRGSKHVLFRQEGTHYFCSRECMDRFISPRKKEDKAA